MNKRISELAKEANANELSYAYYRGEKRPENAVTLHSVDLEKFAELIVRECADWMRNEHNDAGDRIGDSLYWSDRMLTHFGLKDSGTFRS